MTELTETAVTAKNPAAPVSSFEDSRTQAVYEVLVNDNYPPAGGNEHWEGWKARLIVDALFPIEAPAAMHSDLHARCVELLAWRETGTLPGEALRTLAREKYGDRHDALQRAECDTETEALNFVAAAPTTQQEAQEPVAWYVTGCGRLLDEDEAKAEARHIGGTARAIPLYTVPQADSVTAPAATVIKKGADRQWMSERLGHLPDGIYSLYLAPPTQAADSVLEDAALLDWLLLHISGAEFRRIGVHYSGNARRADVDTARKQGANHD